jgi:hypothetical protein
MAVAFAMQEDKKIRKRPIQRLFRERLVLENVRDEDIVSRYRLSREAVLKFKFLFPHHGMLHACDEIVICEQLTNQNSEINTWLVEYWYVRDPAIP